MKTIFVIALSTSAVLLSACATTAPLPNPKVSERLVFIPAAAAFQEFAAPNSPAAADATLIAKDQLADIAGQCGAEPTKAPMVGLIAPLADWAFSQVTSWLVDTADQALKDEIAQYTRSRSAATTTDFYNVMSSSAAAGLSGTRPSRACFRLSLRDGPDPKKPDVVPPLITDFVASVVYDPAMPEVVTIRPVRLYYSRIDTPSKDGKVVIAIKLTADIVSLGPQSASRQNGAIDTAIAKASLDAKQLAKDGMIYQTFADSKGTEVPLPAWNRDSAPAALDLNTTETSKGTKVKGSIVRTAAAPAHDRMYATMTITEAGNVPWLLKNLEKLLSGNKDGIAKNLASEAEKDLGVK
jgi:hypothetical protein